MPRTEAKPGHRKAALVVDDSRVAAAMLRRMLEQHGIAVDTAESGEEAIEFLHVNVLPGVVFLDHMMPGMDGFATLAAIRADARLATLPVVMYTSKEGEAYSGQALARGAYDVLRKPPTPVELQRILQRLALLSEMVEIRRSADAAVGGSPSIPVSVPAAAPRIESAVPAPVSERAAPAPDAERVRAQSSATGAVPERSGWFARALYTALLLVPAVWFYGEYREAERGRAAALIEVRDLQTSRRQAVAAEMPGVEISEEAAARPSVERTALLDAVVWAVNLTGQYDFDQLPLDDQRLTVVRELVRRLTRAHFQGTIRVHTHVGEFCLVRDGFGGFTLPADRVRLSECEIVNYSDDEAAALGRRQSAAFARYVAAHAADNAPIRIEVVSHGNETPLIAYPDPTSAETAGDWNAVARRNNRVQLAIVPR